MITIQNLHKSFGRNQVLQGIDLTLQRQGAITAVLGPNGSGKTTLIKCLLGMVIPNEGQICFAGKPVAKQWEYRAQIDYLPQIARFPENLRVREIIRLLQQIRGPHTRDQELIALFGLSPYLDKPLGSLSGGTKQKVNLTLAFMYDSPIVILDEPTAGLDPVALIHLKDLLAREKARGKMILVTTHIMSLVEELADEIVFLLEGHIYFRGTIAELKEQCNEEDFERAIAGILTRPAQPIAAPEQVGPKPDKASLPFIPQPTTH
ncbi:MAG: ABC transporter ATP-binding protein [Lewinellaceae bacterium]|nr:ABC transporter ATP-binding protein [Lewinellaceae bacterium]